MAQIPQTRFNDYIKPSKESDRYASYLIFFFWPLLGTVLSFKHYKFKNSRNVIWLFNIFVGTTFGFALGTDSVAYRTDLENLHAKTSYTFGEFWTYLLGESSNSIDIVQPLLNFLVSRVTDSGYVLFGIYGLVFGYFYSRNIWFLIDKVKGKIRIEALAFLVLFGFLVPFWNINGFRYWTATHVFFYGLIGYFEGDKKKLLVMLSALFIHYTYILAVGVFAVYFLLGNRLTLYMGVYIMSIFLSFVNLNVANEYLEKLNSEKVTKRASGYIDEDYAEGYFSSFENARWYIKYRYDFIKILVLGSFFWIFFARRKLIYQNKFMLKMFCIGLLFMAFANITSNIPSMLRFYYIGLMSVSTMLFLFFQLLKFKRRPDWYKVASVFFVFTFCMVELRVGLSNLTLATALGNPFTSTLFDKTISLLEVIKGSR
jgi:hypothetical protein